MCWLGMERRGELCVSMLGKEEAGSFVKDMKSVRKSLLLEEGRGSLLSDSLTTLSKPEVKAAHSRG